MPGFLAPALLGLLALVVTPLLIHLLTRRRPQPRPFPALAFLQRAQAGTASRHRLRHWLVLFLRGLAIAAAVLAGAGLVWRGTLAGDSARPAVVIVDASASMQQRTADGRPWDRARALAGNLVESLSPRPVLILVTGDPLRRSGPGPSPLAGDALATLAEASPGSGDGDPAAAIAAAIQALGEHGGDIHFLTDLARSSLAAIDAGALPETVRLHLVDAGGGGENVGIRNLALAPGLAQVGRPCTVTVHVANYGRQLVTGRVQLEVGTETTVLPLRIEPGAVAALEHELRFDSVGQVPVRAELMLDGAAATRDALAIDDHRNGAFQVVDALPTVLVSDAAADEPSGVIPPLLAGLTAAGLRPQLVDHAGLDPAASAGGLVITADCAVVEPLIAPLRSHLEGGGAWLQIVSSEADAALSRALSGIEPPMALGERIDVSDQERGHVQIGQARLDHRMLESFTSRPALLRSVHSYRFHLTPAGQAADAVVLAAYADGSLAAVERPVLAGRWITLNCSPASVDSNLAATEVLPLLLADLATALIPRRRAQLATDVGRFLTVAGLSDPAGRPLPAMDGRSLVTVPGIHRDAAGALHAVAVPALESDLRRIDPQLVGLTAGDAQSAIASVRTRPLWPWALLLALTALLAELSLAGGLRGGRA